MTGTALAMPLGGIGDFYVEFDELEGTGFQLIPEIGETGNSDAEPMIRNIIDEVEITNLHIYKDLKMPAGGWVRIHVKADRKSTRLNSSHVAISYAVFSLKKKK